MKIGIDIGGSHIAVATVNRDGKIVKKIEQDIINQKNISQYLLDYVDNSIQQLTKTGDIESIGIVAPGNAKGTTITNLVNLGIKEINFESIKEKYHIDVKTMNDAKAAGLAEKQQGTLKEIKDGVFLCLGTGIGAAVFLNHQLLQSSYHPGFEIGHMVIDKNGIECNCGKKGCFETYCSMKRLKDRLQQVLEKEAEENKEQLKIENAIALKKAIEENKNDNKIQEIIQEYIDNLIVGLSNIIDIFEPEVISLGGSFIHFKELLYDELIKQMNTRKNITFNKKSLPEIRLASLGNDAGLIGATLI